MIRENDPIASELKPKLEKESTNWTRRKLKKFEKVFAQAVIASKNNAEAVFEFEGHEFLIGYAACLITFLEGKLK